MLVVFAAALDRQAMLAALSKLPHLWPAACCSHLQVEDAKQAMHKLAAHAVINTSCMHIAACQPHRSMS